MMSGFGRLFMFEKKKIKAPVEPVKRKPQDYDVRKITAKITTLQGENYEFVRTGRLKRHDGGAGGGEWYPFTICQEWVLRELKIGATWFGQSSGSDGPFEGVGAIYPTLWIPFAQIKSIEFTEEAHIIRR